MAMKGYSIFPKASRLSNDLVPYPTYSLVGSYSLCRYANPVFFCSMSLGCLCPLEDLFDTISEVKDRQGRKTFPHNPPNNLKIKKIQNFSHTHTYPYTQDYIYIYVCVCVCVCAYVCMYVGINVLSPTHVLLLHIDPGQAVKRRNASV